MLDPRTGLNEALHYSYRSQRSVVLLALLVVLANCCSLSRVGIALTFVVAWESCEPRTIERPLPLAHSLTRTRSMTFRKNLLALLACAFLARSAAAATEWQCPAFDEDALVATLSVCVDDPDGLCGETCVAALISGALAIKDDVMIPCAGGIDGVIENVLKRCTAELGGTFDPCDGRVERALRENAANAKCLEGGTLADYL